MFEEEKLSKNGGLSLIMNLTRYAVTTISCETTKAIQISIYQLLKLIRQQKPCRNLY